MPPHSKTLEGNIFPRCKSRLFFRLNGAAFVLFKRPMQFSLFYIWYLLLFDGSNNLSIAFAMGNLRIFILQLFFYRKKTKKIWIAWQRGKRKLLEKEMSSPHDFWSPTLSDNPTFLHIGIHSTTFQGNVEEKWRWKNWHRFVWHLDITCCQYQYFLHVFCN